MSNQYGFPAIHNGTMVCPVCGFQCTHLSYSHTVDDGDYPETGYDFMVRGDTIVIGGWCENGCEFSILFGQHKGDTKVAVFGTTHDERVCEGIAFDSPVERQFWVAAHTWGELPRSLAGMVPQHRLTSNWSDYRLDFAIPERRLAIEVDGLAYHNGQESFIRDRERQRVLEIDGWRVLRFAAKEVMSDARQCVQQAIEWARAA